MSTETKYIMPFETFKQPDVITLKETYPKFDVLQRVAKLDPSHKDWSEDLVKAEEISRVRKMLKLISKKNLTMTVHYSKKVYAGNACGRYYRSKSEKAKCCYQELSKVLRRLVINGRFDEIDIKNSHVSILIQLCEKYQVPVEEYTHLKHYYENRDDVLRKVEQHYDVSREQAKLLFLIITYGGSFDVWKENVGLVKHTRPLPIVSDIALDINEISKSAVQHFPSYDHCMKIAKECKGHTFQRLFSSAMAYYLQDVEGKIVGSMYNLLAAKNIPVKGIIHDSVLVESADAKLLDELMEQIAVDTGFAIKLDIKSTAPTEEDLLVYSKVCEMVPESPQGDICDASKSGMVIRAFVEWAALKGMVRSVKGTMLQRSEEYQYWAEAKHDDVFECIREFQQEIQDHDQSLYALFLDSGTKVTSDLSYFIQHTNHKDLPMMKPDWKLVGFADGVLDITSLTFTEKDRVDPHILVRKLHETDYVGMDLCTPYWDKAVSFQLDSEALKESFHAMNGRLFFPVGYDDFQVALTLRGAAGSGKSTVVEVVQSMFHSSQVSTIDKGSSTAFCLEDKDLEVLIIPDAPEDIAEKLDKGTFQKMISGELVSINGKNKKERCVVWKTPFLGASNRGFNWRDDGGSINRRILEFPWYRVVPESQKDLTLKAMMQNEIPAIFVKFLRAYHRLLDASKEVSFWSVCPPELLQIKEENRQSQNPLAAFLSEGRDTNKIWVEHFCGSEVLVEDFKKYYKKYLQIKHPETKMKWDSKVEPAVLSSMGFNTESVNLCKSCNQSAKRGCCENYSASNRYKKVVIRDMRIHGVRKHGQHVFVDDEDL